MKLACPSCKATNRLPSLPTSRSRCGKCKREFTPADLVKAQPEPPAAFQLEEEPDRDVDDFFEEEEDD